VLWIKPLPCPPTPALPCPVLTYTSHPCICIAKFRNADAGADAVRWYAYSVG